MLDLDAFGRDVSRGALGRLATGARALAELPVLCGRLASGGERVLLVDDVPKPASGRDLTQWIGELVGPVRQVVVRPGHAQVVLNEATIASTVAEVGSPALIISLGSGTITDLGKVVSLACGAPLVAVQTAASVNGFSDPLSVLVIGGAKRTRPSAWPAALVIDDRLIDAAPGVLNRSGVGDAIAIWSAPADWYLACRLGLDGPFRDEAVRPVLDAVDSLADPDPDVARRALVDSLTVGGLVIGLADSTAPLSGSEHLTSHILDMAAMARGVEHDLHGAQVGAATVICTTLWHEARASCTVFEVPWAGLSYPADLEQRVRDTWASLDTSGALGEECWTAVARKATRLARHRRGRVRPQPGGRAGAPVRLRRFAATAGGDASALGCGRPVQPTRPAGQSGAAGLDPARPALHARPAHPGRPAGDDRRVDGAPDPTCAGACGGCRRRGVSLSRR